MNGLRKNLARGAVSHFKNAARKNAFPTANKYFASRGLSSVIERKEHAEETIYIRSQEAARQAKIREDVERILALEDDHEHKQDLQELLEKSKEAKYESFISRWGLNDWKFALPIGMFVAIPALYNEVLILDAEMQLVACFIFFASTMYTQVGGMVGKSMDDYSKQVYEDLKGVDDAVYQQIQSAVQADQSALTLAEDFKAYYELRDNLAVAHADLLNHQEQHKYRDAVVKKLESLQALEEAATGALRNRMLTSVKIDVLNTFKNDKKAKEAAMARAMEVIAGGGKGKMGQDVVGDVFKSALKNYSAAYAKQPEGSDPILVQLEKDMKAVAEPPVVEGKGGNVFVTHPMA